MPNIAVVGSISMDLVAVSKTKAGETVIGEAFHTIPGGKRRNQRLLQLG